jgi:tetratricopeptide (TPR) repeat protein
VDPGGQQLAEAPLSVSRTRVRGEFVVPKDAQEGAYEVAITSGVQQLLSSTLIVLSRPTVARFRQACRAEQKKSQAYRLAAARRPDKAMRELTAAEGIYRDAGWAHFEAETIAERAYLLGSTGGKGTEYWKALQKGMIKFNEAGLVCLETGAYGKARLYFARARDLATELDDERNAAINSNNVGEALLLLGFPQQALENFLSALELAAKTGEIRTQATVRKNIAVLHSQQGDYDKALEEFSIASMLFKQAGNHVRATRTETEQQQVETLAEEGVGPVRVGALPVLGDIHEAVAHISGRLKPLTDTKKISLLFNLPPSLPKLLINRPELYQALYNLLLNAIQTARLGDRISFSARPKLLEGRLGIELLVTLREADSENASSLPIGPENHNLLASLTACAFILKRYGGHIAVAGELPKWSQATVWLPSVTVQEPESETRET